MEHGEVVGKAGQLARAQDWESALQLLHHGLQLFPQSAQLLNARAAVHLRTQNWAAGLQDSQAALDLLLPEVEDNRLARAAARWCIDLIRTSTCLSQVPESARPAEPWPGGRGAGGAGGGRKARAGKPKYQKGC